MNPKTVAAYGLAILACGLLLIYGGLLLRVNHVRSLLAADVIELDALYSRWNEAGRPEGASLKQFMEGRNSQFAVWTNAIQMAGVQNRGAFVKNRCKASPIGCLIVSENGKFGWIDSKGAVTEVLRSKLSEAITWSPQSVGFVEPSPQ